jgi:hypothetical protein
MSAAVVNHLHFREPPSPALFARVEDEVVTLDDDPRRSPPYLSPGTAHRIARCDDRQGARVSGHLNVMDGQQR